MNFRKPFRNLYYSKLEIIRLRHNIRDPLQHYNDLQYFIGAQPDVPAIRGQ